MYYRQCLKAARPVVKHWFTDVENHDQPALANNQADIIYGLRETGTNLMILDGEYTRREREWMEAFMFTPNSHFFIGQSGKLRAVSKERAFRAWRLFADRCPA